MADPIEFDLHGHRWTLIRTAKDCLPFEVTPADLAAAGYVPAQHQADRIAELEADLANCEAARRVEKQERDFLRNDSVVRFQERLVAALRETPEDGRGFHSPFTLLADRLASPPVQAAEPEAGEHPMSRPAVGYTAHGMAGPTTYAQPPPALPGTIDALRRELCAALRDMHLKMPPDAVITERHIGQLADRLERK